MKRVITLPNLMFLILMVMIWIPGKQSTESPAVFAAVLCLMEIIYLLRVFRGEKVRAADDMMLILYGILLIWETVTAKLGIGHTTLVPSPENVFYAFIVNWELMVKGIFSSLQLLIIGFTIALTLGVGLGMVTGWYQRLRDVLFPLAKVISPIPPIIYTPYVVALMPSFRSASAAVIVMGIFWPTFMNTIIRVSSMEKRILDSARMMCLSNRMMITKVLLPYVLPGIVSGLRVTLSTSFLILTMAEMMGASSGLGYFIKNYSDYANYTNVAAGILLVGIVVTILNKGIEYLEKRVVKWRM